MTTGSRPRRRTSRGRRPGVRHSPARKDTSLRRFYQFVGEEQLSEMLQLSAEPRFHQLLELLQDPTYARHSFARLCELAGGITIIDAMEMVRQHHLLIGMMESLTHLPQVMVDMAKDARARSEPCPRCDGSGRIPRPEVPGGTIPCPRCQGEGKVRVPGDPHAREAAFRVLLR